jgi:hypothetical protein
MNDKYIKVSINETGIISESANIDITNPLRPVFSAGRRGSINRVIDGGLQATFNANYYVEPNREPNIGIVNYIKSWTGSNFENYKTCIGGISGVAVLESLALRINPNEPITASVRFISYYPVSGTNSNLTTAYNPSGASGIAHGWTTKFFLNGNQVTTGNFYSVDYSFRANWSPIYTIESSHPVQIDLNTAEETLQITRDFYKTVGPSGVDSTTYYGVDTIRVYDLANIAGTSDNYFEISLKSGYVGEVRVDTTPDDILRVVSTIQKYY